uniref:Transmembrane protein n=1 Tax=Globisporangium ultimum (strain ATCC 200006 / CBS 805.95 / DAOM BR144) TaxID=431595 RepID=K3WX95_GLOUD
MWRGTSGGDDRSGSTATSDSAAPFDVHRIDSSSSAERSSRRRQRTQHSSGDHDESEPKPELPPSSLTSVASNPSVASIASSTTRQRTQREIAATFFGPSSQATDMYFQTDHEGGDASFHDYYSHDSETDDDVPGSIKTRSMSTATGATRSNSQLRRQQYALQRRHSADNSDAVSEAVAAASRRRQRKENEEKFKEIVRLADARQSVNLSTFTRKASRSLARKGSKYVLTAADRKLNTELLEAYVAYSRSIGHEPQIEVDDAGIDSDEIDEDDEDGTGARRESFIVERPVVKDHTHLWTEYIGTRHSKRRGCIQFWAWLFIGIIVSIVMALFLAHLSLNEVLHLDAFVKQNVVVTRNFTFLHLRDEVSFHLRYDISSQVTFDADGSVSNTSYFQVLLLSEDDFEDYVEGKPFQYVAEGSKLRTTYASLSDAYIQNDDDMYFVVQPCILPTHPELDYCQTRQLPTPLESGTKVFKLKQRAENSGTEYLGLALRRIYVNPMPDQCSDSGWKGGSYLFIFLPFIIVALFGLRVFQMLYRCESFRANLERNYKKEFDVPEDEVDYWQPLPWDRKVPKTRLLGPCCWKKMRKPYEPFYTWWRHENYFTWIFFPYRNERLSMGERAIIIFCSLYLTFYVLFVLVMLRDSLGDKLSLFASVVIYYVLIMILPSLGKAIFKEIFKLIFRQRRKYFRVQAAGGDTSGFSFRFAFLLQCLVAVLIGLTQGPMFYIWLYRSCTFLKKFMYFGILAAITRLSILGLVMDYSWYLVIKTWGWRDTCPYCTERLVHCDCFNDEMLVLAVERVGPKWDLIMLFDKLFAKQRGYTPQFELYTAEQLRERWQILVERATAHIEKLEKLRAYHEKERMDKLRRERHRQSFLNATSFLSFRGGHDSTRASSIWKKDDDNNVDVIMNAAVRDTDGGQHSAAAQRDFESHTEEDDDDDERDSDDLMNGIGCSLREKKVLELNGKIQLDKFEKHYDSTIVDVFHSIQDTLSRRQRHARRALERQARRRQRRHAGQDESDSDHSDGDRDESDVRPGSGSSSSGGETMWVFDDPQQRLARREREKLRRKRAFRVLDNYFIESIETERDPQSGQVRYVVAGDAPAPSTSLAAPVAASPGAAAAPGATTPLSAARRELPRDNKRMPLLRKASSQRLPRDEDVVVVVSEPLDQMVPVTVHEDGSDSENESKPQEPDHVAELPPRSRRTYAVMERQPSLLRRMSSSANSFAAWVFKYDQDERHDIV